MKHQPGRFVLLFPRSSCQSEMICLWCAPRHWLWVTKMNEQLCKTLQRSPGCLPLHSHGCTAKFSWNSSRFYRMKSDNYLYVYQNLEMIMGWHQFRWTLNTFAFIATPGAGWMHLLMGRTSRYSKTCLKSLKKGFWDVNIPLNSCPTHQLFRQRELDENNDKTILKFLEMAPPNVLWRVPVSAHSRDSSSLKPLQQLKKNMIS